VLELPNGFAEERASPACLPKGICYLPCIKLRTHHYTPKAKRRRNDTSGRGRFLPTRLLPYTSSREGHLGGWLVVTATASRLRDAARALLLCHLSPCSAPYLHTAALAHLCLPAIASDAAACSHAACLLPHLPTPSPPYPICFIMTDGHGGKTSSLLGRHGIYGSPLTDAGATAAGGAARHFFLPPQYRPALVRNRRRYSSSTVPTIPPPGLV